MAPSASSAQSGRATATGLHRQQAGGLAGTHNTAGREAIVDLHGMIEHTDETAESQWWPAGVLHVALSEASRKQPGAARSQAAQQQTFTVVRCVGSQHET